MIARRAFVLSLVGAVAPVIARAQSKVHRIGVLIWWPEDQRMVEQLREAFREAGLVDGRNVTLEFRWAAGSVERATALAAELVRMNVDVLVVRTTPAIKAAQDATRTIPIVMMSADPVGVGVVATLARPGGNVTGVSQNSVAPADLPVQEPTNFELIINLKTAKAIGLTIPPSVLLRADRVIE
jgi:putative tryptophan/tyrosine transport system substrate-binding protein